MRRSPPSRQSAKHSERDAQTVEETVKRRPMACGHKDYAQGRHRCGPDRRDRHTGVEAPTKNSNAALDAPVVGGLPLEPERAVPLHQATDEQGACREDLKHPDHVQSLPQRGPPVRQRSSAAAADLVGTDNDAAEAVGGAGALAASAPVVVAPPAADAVSRLCAEHRAPRSAWSRQRAARSPRRRGRGTEQRLRPHRQRRQRRARRRAQEPPSACGRPGHGHLRHGHLRAPR